MASRRPLFLAVSVLAPLHAAVVFAQQSQGPPTAPSPPWGWYGPGHMWGMGWGFWWIMPLIMLVIFLAPVVLILLALGRGWGSGVHWGPPWHMMDRSGRFWSDPTHSALQILSERYAKGEIDKAEYEERKATILSSRGR